MIFRIFKREIKSSYKSLLSWSVGLTAIVVIGFFEFSAIANSGQSMDEIFSLMPRVVRVMFGVGTLSIDTPQGFYACMFLWIALIACAYAALLGAGILAKEEQEKTAEFLFTRPVTRSTVITAKILAGIFNLLVIAAVIYAGTAFAFLPNVKGVDLSKEVLTTYCGLFFTQLIFFFFGLFISTVTKNAKRASTLSATFLLVSYFGSVFIEMSENKNLDILSPMRYFDCVGVMEHGFNLILTLAAAFLIVLFTFLTYRCFTRRSLNT